MPISLPKPDPQAFSDRLNELLTARGVPDRGRGADLAAMFAVKPPTVSGWLNGRYMPEADKVLAMAEHWRVGFDWLYFGRGDPPSVIRRHRGLEDPEAPATPEQAIERLRGDMQSVRAALIAFAAAAESKTPGVAAAFLVNLQATARDAYYSERGFHGLLEASLEQLAGSEAAEQPAAPAGPARKASRKSR
jgi:transcriptional regulator with XRE-family HTH domain